MAVIKKYITLFMLAAVVVSCEYSGQWEINPSERRFVVDALITSENKPQLVTMFYSSTELNADPEPLSGAQIQLKGPSGIVQFTESNEKPGYYYSPAILVLTGIEYTLVVEYAGLTDSAKAIMQAVSPLEPYQIVPGDSLFHGESLFRYEYIESAQPSMMEITYDWSVDQDFCQHYGACLAAESYYTLESIDIGEEFGPPRQVIWFPAGTKIIRKNYSLSDAHQQFVRSLLIETAWRGGLFDTEQGNVPSNFEHGTLGWFALCQVVSDSIQLGF